MLPHVSGPLRGRTQGRALVIRTQAGGITRAAGAGSHPVLPFAAGAVRVSRPGPDDPNRASGEGEDGSDLPFSAAGAARRGRVGHTGYHARCHTRPAYWAVAPVLMYPCGKAPPARARAGRRSSAASAAPASRRCALPRGIGKTESDYLPARPGKVRLPVVHKPPSPLEQVHRTYAGTTLSGTDAPAPRVAAYPPIRLSMASRNDGAYCSSTWSLFQRPEQRTRPRSLEWPSHLADGGSGADSR